MTWAVLLCNDLWESRQDGRRQNEEQTMFKGAGGVDLQLRIV